MNMLRSVPSRLRLVPALLSWVTLAAGSQLAAQQDRTFAEEKRITAIDLVLGFEAGAVRDWATDNPVPSGLQRQDFEIFYDGQPRPVVGLESGAEPWQIVVYFDAVLTSSAGLRWAATTLAGRSDDLVALGEVAIVVADPAPWTLLPPTRDRDRLNASLSQLARFQEGSDELLNLRTQVIEERFLPKAAGQPAPTPLEGDDGAPSGTDLLAAVAAEEARIVRARHDDLLLELAGRDSTGIVLIANGGYDLEPAEFYRSLSDHPTTAADRKPAVKGLDGATQSLARTLAAYGWVALPLLPPVEDPLKKGIRIGKLRLTGPSVEVERTRHDWEEYDRTIVRLFGARLEGHRKPKRAEAFLELGAALQGQDKFAEAEDALRQAIYHFAGDPKTAERQAIAFARLGAVLEAQEQPQRANAARQLAQRLDPSIQIGEGVPVAALLEPLTPLETLARITAGRVVRGDRDLAAALEGLGQRVRLTYQVTGVPDGRLHTLEARFKGSRELIYPGWARASIPESVAAARARRLLAGEPTAGTLALSADFVTTFGDREQRQGEVHLVLEPPAEADGENMATGVTSDTTFRDATLRLTLGVGGPDVEPTVEHRRLGSQALREPWSYRVGFEMPEGRPWLAVLVEDLETGAWGGRLIEIN